MTTISFKSCPRCRGDLHYESDIYGKYLTCLQCGYSLDQSEAAKLYDRLKNSPKSTPDAHLSQTHSGPHDEMIDSSG